MTGVLSLVRNRAPTKVHRIEEIRQSTKKRESINEDLEGLLRFLMA